LRVSCVPLRSRSLAGPHAAGRAPAGRSPGRSALQGGRGGGPPAVATGDGGGGGGEAEAAGAGREHRARGRGCGGRPQATGRGEFVGRVSAVERGQCRGRRGRGRDRPEEQGGKAFFFFSSRTKKSVGEKKKCWRGLLCTRD